VLCPNWAPFHGIVPGAVATPVSQIALPVIFGTRENFHTKIIQFEVTDVETMYNAFLGQPALSKHMAILDYAYLVLKMPGPCGIISIRGNLAFDCDRESCEIAGIRRAPRVEASLVRVPPPNPVMPAAKMSIQLKDTLSKTIPLSMEEPSKVAHVGNSFDPK
jgi:hypothetical protein